MTDQVILYSDYNPHLLSFPLCVFVTLKYEGSFRKLIFSLTILMATVVVLIKVGVLIS